jgi:5-methylcytosine-specific restriction endonuclease McrA
MSFAWLLDGPEPSPRLVDEYHPHYPAHKPKKKKRRRTDKNNRKRRERLIVVDPHCKYCGKELTIDNSTLDHIKPVARGGTNHPDNLALACGPCNNKKGNKSI